MTRLILWNQYGPLFTITNQYQPFLWSIIKHYFTKCVSPHHWWPVVSRVHKQLGRSPGKALSMLRVDMRQHHFCLAPLSCQVKSGPTMGGGDCYAGRNTWVLNGSGFQYICSRGEILTWRTYILYTQLVCGYRESSIHWKGNDPPGFSITLKLSMVNATRQPCVNVFRSFTRWVCSIYQLQ